MILLKSSLNSGAIFLAGLLCFTGCARLTGPLRGEAPAAAAPGLHLAVLPIVNLSGTAAPLKDLRQAVIRGLTEKGITVLAEEDLEKFMDRHRLRFTAGLDGDTGKAFKEEAGIDAVLISSLDLYNVTDPPKVALTARLIATGGNPKVLWMASRGSAGDDAPGILGIGLIDDPRVLAFRQVRSLVDSLDRHLSGSAEGKERAGSRFEPKTSFRSPVLSTDLHYRVAVVPFYNKSLRKNAGEIMGLQFLAALARRSNFEVIDPGVIRERLLRFRIIMDQGVSVSDADVLFQSADVDLILGGTVYDYEDFRGSYGTPKVAFSVQVLEKKSRETVWSSDSFGEGNEGVFFFGMGRESTADAMAAQMAELVVERLTEK